jgi:DNA invertase Pin-like site-specific DNA recombinase
LTIYGYARVSTSDQDTQIQEAQLKEAGAQTIISEKKSGKDIEGRDKLSFLLEMLSSGDTLIVTKLDRFSRSTIDTLKLIEELNNRGVVFRSLDLGLATDTPMGKFALTIFSAVSELERNRIRERQMEGVLAAKKKGAYKGRKSVFEKHIPAVKKLKELGYSVSHIVGELGISRPTVYKCLK